jgi:RNA polymerase sigma-70 factor (ECF subfamily)
MTSLINQMPIEWSTHLWPTDPSRRPSRTAAAPAGSPTASLAGACAPGWQVPVPETAGSRPAPALFADLQDADDRTLVAAFNAGSDDAFAVIVERHRRQIYQLCYRFVGNHEDAADLAQDVFVRAFRGLQRFKGEAALGTWLYRVAVNTCLNRVGARRPETQPIVEADPVDPHAADPLHEVLRKEMAVTVRRAIQRLPPKQRATLLLRVYQELPHEEIARVLGSSVGAVKANFFHALGNLKRLMKS